MTTSSFLLLLQLALLAVVDGFVVQSPPFHHHGVAITTTSTPTSTSRMMGMFDFFKGAFENEAFEDRRATASHILVETEEEALVVQKEIAEGTSTFAQAATKYSTCPSGKKGGSLGTFEPGVMVQEFDDVVFGKGEDSSAPIGEVVGPVATKFGYHLIKVDERFEIQDKTDGSPAF